jgi:hypothetical protein
MAFKVVSLTRMPSDSESQSEEKPPPPQAQKIQIQFLANSVYTGSGPPSDYGNFNKFKTRASCNHFAGVKDCIKDCIKHCIKQLKVRKHCIKLHKFCTFLHIFCINPT